MIRIAKISLDIRKDAVANNDPIILRQGESDVIIEATILNGGDETLQINFATFVAKKPDGTIVSNDPANVNGSVISYSVSNHLTESVGKIQDAYFMINNQITTCGFDISIIPSTQLDDTSVSYIPGIENINKFLTDAENDWLGRIQQMKSQIAGLDIPTEFKLLMDKALSDAKAQYQPIIDAAEENVESIAADLAAKKLDLTNNSDELNKTIADIKAQLAPVNSFLDDVQKQIIEANASFTADQQAKVAQSISNLKAQIDALTVAKTGPKGDKGDIGPQGPKGDKGDKGDTGSVDNDGLIKAPAFVELQTQVDNSAVGTNLLLKTYEPFIMKGSTIPFQWQSMYVLSRRLEKGTTVTLSFDAVSTAPVKFYVQNDGSNGGTSSGTTWMLYAEDIAVDTTQKHYVATATLDGFADVGIKGGLRNTPSTATITVSNVKLELGSHATDYSLNPSEILTQSDYAKIKAAIVALGGSLS